MKNQNFLSFIGGLAIGAIAALLLAPDSGANTRNKISGKIKHGKKKMQELQEMVEEKIREVKLSTHPESYDTLWSMVNDSSMGRVEQSFRDLKEYAALRVESFRLSLIENLATLFNSLFGIFVLSVLIGIAIIFFAIALTWLLGIALGSVLLAIVLMGCLFLLLAVIVYLVRGKLIINQSVRLLSRMIDNMSQKHPDYEKES